MYFQVLDSKQECIGFYKDGCVSYENPDDSCTRTWKYSPSLSNREDVGYANLLCLGRTLDQVCPDYLKDQWSAVSGKIAAFSRSIATSKIDVNDHCIFDLIPESHVANFLEIRNRITKHVFDTYDKPDCYDHLLSVSRLTSSIACHDISINFANIKKDLYIKKVRTFSKKLNKKLRNVLYNPFGTKTGRLTVERTSFPILTLDKDLRKYIEPSNDVFVELDINGAEIRTMLALLEKPQPQVDIHDWNLHNIYNNVGTREEAKKRFFAWLYNDNSEDRITSKFYSKDQIKEKFWSGTHINTPFHRNIESDEYHSINYVLQSTSNDICLEQACKINKLLSGKQSNVAFMMHDSVVLDYSAKEQKQLEEIISTFQDTRFGTYKINVSIGKNFGNMRKIDWK